MRVKQYREKQYRVTALKIDYYSKPWVEDLSPATSYSSYDCRTYIWQTKESFKLI